MDRIKSELTHALVSVDKARNHYRDNGCDAQLPFLILDAKQHVDAARDAISNRFRHTRRSAVIDPEYPDLIPGFTDAADCPACRHDLPTATVYDRAFHTCGVLGPRDDGSASVVL